jgi:putative sigma-54 modulation protein
MKVLTQSVNFNADQKLIDFIQKRMDKLDLFFDKIIKSNVYLKVENTSCFGWCDVYGGHWHLCMVEF